ncbi:MAG: hypothetical protein ACI9Y1_003040 [Lentisphaeria bacterium]|jgi:hypothetical protein
MKSLEELSYLAISTSQTDLSDRISVVFDIMKSGAKGTNADFAQAFSDVIGDQPYAGSISLDDEINILDWISKTYDEESESYIDAVATLYCMMTSDRALNELQEKLSSAKYLWVRQMLQEALDAFTPNT